LGAAVVLAVTVGALLASSRPERAGLVAAAMTFARLALLLAAIVVARSDARRPRAVSARPRVLGLAVPAGVLLAASIVLVLVHLPRPISGIAALTQCSGWPMLAFEGEGWTSAFPGDPASVPRQVAIAGWPGGMRFDEASGVLRDAQGDAVFRSGDRMRVKGSVVQVYGDPSPCWQTRAVSVEEVTSP
jgi:hypothetical protein